MDTPCLTVLPSTRQGQRWSTTQWQGLTRCHASALIMTPAKQAPARPGRWNTAGCRAAQNRQQGLPRAWHRPPHTLLWTCYMPAAPPDCPSGASRQHTHNLHHPSSTAQLACALLHYKQPKGCRLLPHTTRTTACLFSPPVQSCRHQHTPRRHALLFLAKVSTGSSRPGAGQHPGASQLTHTTCMLPATPPAWQSTQRFGCVHGQPHIVGKHCLKHLLAAKVHT